MSTRINVTVGDGGLLDRNAQQTAANRQARVLADQRATAEAEGVERRAADRIAAGLDPLTGLPASTPSSASTINPLNQEPAANRKGGFGVLLQPTSDYTNYGGTLSGLRSVTRSQSFPSIFARLLHEDTTEYFYGRRYPEMEFLPTGGPNANTGALQISPVFTEVENTTTTTDLGFELTNPVTTYTESQGLVYVAGSSYDTVLQWQYPPLFSTEQDSSARILNLSGDVVNAISKAPSVAKIKACTHEMYMRVGSTSQESAFLVNNLDRFQGGPSTRVVLELEGARFSAVFVQKYDVSATFSANSAGSILARTFTPIQYKELIFGVLGWNVTRQEGPAATNSQYLSSNDPNSTAYDPKLPTDVEDSSWIHLAVVRRPVPDSELFLREVYLNGVKVVDSIFTTEQWASTFGTQPVSARITLEANRGAWPPATLGVPGIHGYRFTPKALYEGSTFVPPPVITRLA
jgi:hypothetical protein